jgi:hypothetical protein
MKINFANDYRSQTASHFTTFSQTQQSANILAKNRNKLDAIANNNQSTINNRAVNKLRNSLLGANIDLFS